MGADTQTLDALEWVYKALDERKTYIAAGRELEIVKAIPGYAGCRYVGVIVTGIEREGAHTIVNVGLDLWTQEVGVGADAPMLEILALVDRLCISVLRAASLGGTPDIGTITCPGEFSEMTANKTFFYNITITIPVHIGGGV